MGYRLKHHRADRAIKAGDSHRRSSATNAQFPPPLGSESGKDFHGTKTTAALLYENKDIDVISTNGCPFAAVNIPLVISEG